MITPARTLGDIAAQWRIWLWALVALGAALRFQGLSWDHGLMLHPDERNLVWAGLALAWPDRLVPDFHAYNGLSVYPPRLLAALLAGDMPSAPQAALAARLISAALSTLAILAAGGIGRLLAGPTGALGAAFLTALNPALIQWAHFGTSESALVLCALVLWRIAAGFVAGEMRLWPAALLSGLVLGLGLGTKTSAAVFAVIPLAALIVAQRGGWGRAALATLTAMLIAGAILLATTPAILLKWEDYSGIMTFECGVVDGTQDVFWTWQFEDARDVIFELRQFVALTDPVTVLLLAAGAVAFAGNRRAVPVLAFLLVYAAIVFAWHAKFIRYLAPMLAPLLVLAGCLMARIAAGWGGRFLRTAAVLSAAATTVTGLSFAAMYQQADPRQQSWDWLAPRLFGGSVLLVEPTETGPPFPDPPPAGAFGVEVVPLTEPAGPDKLAAIAERLARGDWMLISSRRQYGVLPALDRFPAMCGYYRALFSGRLGWEVAARFRRRSPVLNLWEPADRAEETFSVFDHPRPMILRRVADLGADEIRARIVEAGEECK